MDLVSCLPFQKLTVFFWPDEPATSSMEYDRVELGRRRGETDMEDDER